MFSYFHKIAADINLYLYIGVGYIRQVITDYAESYGEGYNSDFVDKVQNEIIQFPNILEDQIVQEGWADTVALEFDGGYEIHGIIEYEGVETELDAGEITELEKITEDFVFPFVEEAIDVVDVDDLIWIPVESSNVESFAYDAENRFFYVRFLPSGTGDFSEGSTYVYHDVEPAIYEQFFAAPSKGRAVWQLLRDRYDYDRLS